MSPSSTCFFSENCIFQPQKARHDETSEKMYSKPSCSRLGNWSPENESKLHKITQLIAGTAETKTLISWISKVLLRDFRLWNMTFDPSLFAVSFLHKVTIQLCSQFQKIRWGSHISRSTAPPTGAPTERWPSEHKARRRPSASQGERPRKKPTLPTPWSQAQNCENIHFCCLITQSVVLCCGCLSKLM